MKVARASSRANASTDREAPQFIPNSQCLHISRGFHMAFIQAACTDTHHA